MIGEHHVYYDQITVGALAGYEGDLPPSAVNGGQPTGVQGPLGVGQGRHFPDHIGPWHAGPHGEVTGRLAGLLADHLSRAVLSQFLQPGDGHHGPKGAQPLNGCQYHRLIRHMKCGPQGEEHAGVLRLHQAIDHLWPISRWHMFHHNV